MKRITLIVAALLLVGACSAPVVTPSPTPVPMPTPQVIVKTVEVPGPTVYKVPQVCLNAIDMLVKALDSENTLLGFYLDGKEPPQEAFEKFLEGDPETMFKIITECVKYPNP